MTENSGSGPGETPIVEQVAAAMIRADERWMTKREITATAVEAVALVGSHIAQQIEAERIKYSRDAEDHNYNDAIDAAARIAREVGR